MPNYIEFRKNSEPVSPAQVDDLMREAFGAEPDSQSWYRSWYDTVGVSLAFGVSRENIEYRFPEHQEIIKWLFDNFTFNAYWMAK